MADKAPRSAMVIRTIEGRATPARPGLSADRYREQVRKLQASGVRMPKTPRAR